MLFLLLGIVLSFWYFNSNNKPTQDIKIDIEDTINSDVDLLKSIREQYQNNDIVGTISIIDTGIDELILQSSDNDFYLDHDNYGNFDKYGSIFLDYRCNAFSKKLLVFGHSSVKRDTPFNNLEKYYDKDYYEEHSDIKVIYNNEVREYTIFSVYVETSDFSYMNLNISEDTYNGDLRKYKEKSLYNTGIDVYNGDEILVLQTCSNLSKYREYKDKYLLIIAKRMK